MKNAVVALAILALAGVAFGASLNVPFFLDNGDQGALPPASGSSGFIGVVNTTTEDIPAQVFYTSGQGVDGTPGGGANTFLIPGSSTVSWRPVADDPVEGPAGQAVPNVEQPGTGTIIAGSARIVWTGDATDVQGRYQQFDSNGGVSAYLLPAGQN